MEDNEEYIDKLPLLPMRCLQCDQNFQDPQIFEKHIQEHQLSIKSELTCEKCGSVFDDQQDLLSHQVVIDACVENDNVVNSHESFNEEERECERCVHCGVYLVDNAHSLKEHLTLVHKIQEEGQKISKEKLQNADFRLVSFLKSCPISKENPPSKDLEEISEEFEIREWEDISQQPKKGYKKRIFHCPQCPEKFRIKTHLRWHIEAHGIEFPCSSCTASFTTAQALTYHQKSFHSAEEISGRENISSTNSN